MMQARWLIRIGLVCVLGGFIWLLSPDQPYRAQADSTISGTVLGEQGPVAGATVRVQGTRHETLSDAQGRFTLSGLDEGVTVALSAWKQTYYCTKVEAVKPPVSGVVLTLRLYQTNDNPAYEWIPPTGDNSCASCKAGVTEVWLKNDAHAGSARNVRFLTMYNGTDVEGRQSPPTRYSYNRDYGSFPLRPDLSQPYYGPGYKLDFPDTAGNCAACHTPGAAIDTPYATDPNSVTGANAFGVHCDFCHKVADVKLDSATGMPLPNMPGVLSMDIRRPFPEDKARYQIFFGTFDDDNVPAEDTNLPLIAESQFCAPCHFGVFWDTTIYNSFGEWLVSPYSNPATGKTCQQCHMPAPTLLDGQPMTNVAPGKGGIERDPAAIHAHTFPGAANTELLRNAVTMTVSAERREGQIVVTVKVVNDRTGHHVPTDSPLRQVFVIVSAADAQKQALALQSGPTLPDWAGDLKGLPGVYFAKILQELWTEVMPTGAYWMPTRVVEDTRLAALETNTSTYVFGIPAGASGAIEVNAKLVFRRAYYDLMQQKGWDSPDILMAEGTASAP